MEVKTKTLNRSEWYNNTERDFKFKIFKDELFDGVLGLITFTDLKTPEMVTNSKGDLCIGDNGYRWLELVPRNKNWVLTSMINNDNELFQLYFDISKDNTISNDGNVTFKDVFLDVVVAGDDDPVIIDGDELSEALATNVVTKEEYDLYYKTANEIVDFIKNNRALVYEKLYSYADMF